MLIARQSLTLQHIRFAFSPSSLIQFIVVQITATAQDFRLASPASGSITASFTDITTQVSTLNSQYASMSAMYTSQMAVMSGQVSSLTSMLAASSSTIDALNSTVIDSASGLAAQDTQTMSQLNDLAGIVDQVSQMDATRATQTQLDNVRTNLLAAIQTNSTSLIAAMVACTNRGAGAYYDVNSRQCSVVRTVTRVFTCAGQVTQSFTVPTTGVSSLHVQLWGGGGAGSVWNTGGAGGYVEGDIAVNGGDLFTLQVTSPTVLEIFSFVIVLVYSESEFVLVSLQVACSQPANNFCPGACGTFYVGGWPGANLNIFAASGGGGYTGMFRGTSISPSTAVAVAGGGGGGGGGPRAIGTY